MGTVKTGKIKSVLKSQKKAVSASPTITPSHMLRANALMFVIWGGGGERHKRTNSGSRGKTNTKKRKALLKYKLVVITRKRRKANQMFSLMSVFLFHLVFGFLP